MYGSMPSCKAGRPADRGTDRWADRQTDKQAERQTNKHVAYLVQFLRGHKRKGDNECHTGGTTQIGHDKVEDVTATFHLLPGFKHGVTDVLVRVAPVLMGHAYRFHLGKTPRISNNCGCKSTLYL